MLIEFEQIMFWKRK